MRDLGGGAFDRSFALALLAPSSFDLEVVAFGGYRVRTWRRRAGTALFEGEG